MSHEPQGLDSRRLAMAGAILAASTFVVLVICHFLWRGLADTPMPPARMPGTPRLQPYPTRDLQAFRHEQEQHDRWEWADRDHRVARIPVQRAMELMAREKPR